MRIYERRDCANVDRDEKISHIPPSPSGAARGTHGCLSVGCAPHGRRIPILFSLSFLFCVERVRWTVDCRGAGCPCVTGVACAKPGVRAFVDDLHSTAIAMGVVCVVHERGKTGLARPGKTSALCARRGARRPVRESGLKGAARCPPVDGTTARCRGRGRSLGRGGLKFFARGCRVRMAIGATTHRERYVFAVLRLEQWGYSMVAAVGDADVTVTVGGRYSASRGSRALAYAYVCGRRASALAVLTRGAWAGMCPPCRPGGRGTSRLHASAAGAVAARVLERRAGRYGGAWGDAARLLHALTLPSPRPHPNRCSRKHG
ncbi:hypothetical protein C8R46DRAFT_80772 [Mycena filopes]|nr:hypothetical protein C8R46DRAFT_80772 [Mycena filopes]